jgi:hypothetical protein
MVGLALLAALASCRKVAPAGAPNPATGPATRMADLPCQPDDKCLRVTLWKSDLLNNKYNFYYDPDHPDDPCLGDNRPGSVTLDELVHWEPDVNSCPSTNQEVTKIRVRHNAVSTNKPATCPACN